MPRDGPLARASVADADVGSVVGYSLPAWLRWMPDASTRYTYI